MSLFLCHATACFYIALLDLCVTSPCHLELSDHHGKPAPLFPFCCHISEFRQLHSSYFMYLVLGRPLLLLPFLHASIISFSNQSDRITCPQNPSFLLIAVCCSVSL